VLAILDPIGGQRMIINSQREWTYAGGLIAGMSIGLAAGVFFTMVAVVIRIANGPTAFDEYGGSFIGVAAVYLGGFTLGGITTGILNPLGRSRIGSAALGVIGFIPVSFGMAFLITGELIPTDYDYLIATMGTCITLGICAGLAMHHELVNPWTRSNRGEHEQDVQGDRGVRGTGSDPTG
jgi:hypothetical protein